MFYPKILPYNLDSLEPYIDEETMNQHYNVLYKKYIDNLNKEIWVEVPIEYILKNYRIYTTSVRNNSGGFYNHTLYFENLTPYTNNYEIFASDGLKYMIQEHFGSKGNLLKNIKEVGSTFFGSGWVWLIEKDSKPMIVTTANQDNPLMQYDCKILLALDMWEHSYFLKYKTLKADYIDAFFNCINWKKVSERYDYV